MKSSFIIILILISCLLITCKNKEADSKNSTKKPVVAIQQVVGIGKIEPENEIIQLSAEVDGIVEKIYKNENDTVNKGDLIFELKHSIQDATIVQLKQAAAVQKAQIKVDESAIKELQIKYANSSVASQRLINLLAKGAETQQAVDNATTEMQSLMANIDKSQATVLVSKMRWKETNAQTAIAMAELKQKFKTAPAKGILLELNIQTGNYIDSKQIVAQINTGGKTVAVCEIDELFAAKIKIGQSAIIRNFGALDTLSIGKVYFTSSFLKKKSLFTDQSGEKEDRRVREIKILLDNPATILLNSRIECVVFIAKNKK